MKKKLIHSLGKLLPLVLFVVLFSGFSTPIFAEENAAEEDTVVEQQPVDDPSAQDAATDETESKATQVESNSQAAGQAQEDSKADDDVLNVNESTRNITTGTNVNGNETWSNETINVSGQGVIWPKGTLIIKDSTIINNSVRSTRYGDNIAIVVQMTNGKLVLKGVIVEQQGTNGSTRKFVALQEGTKLEAIDTIFNINETSYDPLIWVTQGSTADFENVTFNATSLSAGDSTLIKVGGTLDNANAQGGTVNFKGDNKLSNIKGSIDNNGTINIVNGTTVIENSQIKLKNKGIVVKSGATLKLVSSILDLSELGRNFAIKVESGGKLLIENSSVINADAGSQSPIDLNGATFYAKDATFENNSGSDGGAIRARGSEMTIDGSIFKNNRAHANTIGPGGGNIENGGGAIHADAATTLTLNGTQFIDNYTTNDAKANPLDISYGGAIFFRGHKSRLYINGAKFIGNHAGTSGGAVFVRSSTNVEIKDLNGDPTVFDGNYVTDAHDFAGGGLFINLATVKMWDVAIFDNEAEHAGGGIASCTTGTSEVHSLEGAAIFDNTVEPGGHPDADTPTYKDVFIQTVDHRDADTGELIPAKDGGVGYENYMPELYERMFNGGLHNWQSKIFDGYNGSGRHVTSFISVSNPSNRDISKAKVIFTNNYAKAGNREGRDHAYGGAIGNNGYLIVGTTTTTEIKVVKVWEDNNNNDGLRPTAKQFLEKIHILDGEGNEVDKSQLQIDIVESNINDYALSGNIVKKHEQPEYGDNAWLIVISGLPLLTTGQYSIAEDGVPSYQLVSSTGTDDTYFEITNKHEDEVVDLAVRKVWNDNNDKHKVRPTSVTVRLYADGQEIDSVVLSAENNWQATFGGLKKYNGGVAIEYTISEDAVKYYVAKITGSVEEGFTIENDVDYPEKPKKPEEPKKPNKPNKPEQPKVHGVATGLESMISMYSMMTGLSLVGAVALKRKH